MADRFSNHTENCRFCSGCHIKTSADKIYNAVNVLELAEKALGVPMDGALHPKHPEFISRIKDVRWKLETLIDRLAQINSEMGNES